MFDSETPNFHKNENRCRLCKKKETRITNNGKQLWTKDTNFKGEYTGYYLCYDCTYQKNKKCNMCGKNKYLVKKYNDNGYFMGEYICQTCLNSDYRNGNLDPYSSVGKGYISEVLVAKFLKIDTCFDKTGIFNYRSFDMFETEEWGRINVKGSKLIDNNYHLFNISKNIIPDFFFCIGYDTYRKYVERVYIIPNEDYISKLDLLAIPKYGYSKYHIFMENEKPWDDLFRTLKLSNCSILKNNYL